MRDAEREPGRTRQRQGDGQRAHRSARGRLRALGSLPVFAFSVLPATAGLLLANQLRTAVGLAVLFGMASGGLGYLAAFLFSLPVGASQAAVSVAFAFGAYLWARLRAR